MTIAQMHVWFRQYAQQMGMQNVRAILPEQIDLLINTSITDIVNQVIVQNINVTNDRVITDNSKIGQINALRSLYDVKEVGADVSGSVIANPFTEDTNTPIYRLYANIDDFNIGGYTYWIIVSRYDPEAGEMVYSAEHTTKEIYDQATHKIQNVDVSDLGEYETEDYDSYVIKANPTESELFYLVDLAINYKSSSKLTNWFPVRIIDDIYLADTLNDFVLKPRVRTPIAVIHNKQMHLYIDNLEGSGDELHLPLNLETNSLRVSYIGKPAKVAYKSDIGGQNIDCNLPDYMHVDILKHAVDLYRIAVGNGMYNSQQQQVQSPNPIRNTGMGNEGYQS